MPKGKRDTSGLKVTRAREVYPTSRYPNGWSNNTEPVHGKYAVTEFLFSVTGDQFVERVNYLIEKEWLTDLPADNSCHSNPDPAVKKGDCSYSRRTETRQKFLCVAGPLAGKRVTEAPGYQAYNAANFHRGRNKSTTARVIFVHDSVLKG